MRVLFLLLMFLCDILLFAVSATVPQPAYDMAWCLDGIGVRVVSFTAMFGVRMRR